MFTGDDQRPLMVAITNDFKSWMRHENPFPLVLLFQTKGVWQMRAQLRSSRMRSSELTRLFSLTPHP